MLRLRTSCVDARLVLLLTVPVVPLGVQRPVAAEEKKEAERWLIDRKAAVAPQAVPVPALKYRLYPVAPERKEGNAVPIYLRLASEWGNDTRKELTDKPYEWNRLPLAQVPLAEAKALVEKHRTLFRQLELGARRKSADWNYTLDQGSVIDIAIPDAQWMRVYAGLLACKARAELADGDFAGAARTLETGFAFSRHVGEAPFVINRLVAVACTGYLLNAVADFVEQPNAPNLYWALTALPRPLIDFRGAWEFEQRFPEMQFPDLGDLGRQRSAEQWDDVLRRIRAEVPLIASIAGEIGEKAPVWTEPTEPAAKSGDLAAAKRYLMDRLTRKAAEVNAMPPAQVLILYMAGLRRELSDDLFKAMYLPYAEGRPLLAAARKKLEAAPNNEAGWFARAWLWSVHKLQAAPNRMERRIALLRVVEALRLYAAAHDGRLPDKLADITEVPIPSDPGTGQPFGYRKDGSSATLIGRIPGEPLNSTGIRYTLTLRKQ